MTLSQLRYIVAVDTHRHFGRAAVACHVSQPTLSMGIRKVEEDIGLPIFDRSRTPVTPTDIGRELIEQARVVLREREKIDDIIAKASGEIAGELEIGIIPTVAPYILPLVTRPFAKRYPLVTLSIHEQTTREIIRALEEDRIDAGIIATPERHSGMTLRPLFAEDFVGFVAPEHRLASKEMLEASDLSLEDLWLLSEGHCFREQVINICGEGDHACGPSRSILFESGNLETLRHMVEHGGGMTLLPLLATRYLSAAQRRRFVKPFASPAPHREIGILYGRALLKKRLIDAYTDTLLDVLPPEFERVDTR